MKVLFVTNMPPSYPTNGAIIQTHHFMRLLLEKHEVGLWTFSNEQGPDLGPLAKKLSFVHIEPKRRAQQITGKLRRWGRWLSGHDPMSRWSYDGSLVRDSIQSSFEEFKPDVIMFEQLHMSYPIIDLEHLPNRPLLAFNAHDAIHVVLKRSYSQGKSNIFHRLLNQHFVNVIENFEKKVVNKADVVFSVSDVDAEHLQVEKQASDWAVTPNGVDTDYFQILSDPGDTKPLTMIFIGSLSYGPNIEAIQYYVTQIHEKLRERHPDCVLKIVGQPTAETKKYENIEGIEFVGFHRDFRPFFAEAHVSIVPLLSGSGTRFKILESWAMGKPIVSTTVGAEGLAYKDNENLLIADQADEFVEQVDKLFKEESLRLKLAQNGRQVAEKYYSWNAIVDKLEEKLCEKVNQHHHAHRN